MAATTDIRCTCKVCTRIRVTIDQIFSVLDVYGWLLNSYVVVRNIKNISRTSIFYSVVFVRIYSIYAQTLRCVSLLSSSDSFNGLYRLLSSLMQDFFQEKLWDKLPESWRFALQDTPPQEFGKWLSGDISW